MLFLKWFSKIQIFIFNILIILPLSSSWASNFHEHYSSLASYEDYQYAFATLAEGQPGFRTLDRTFLGPSNGLPGLMEDCAPVFQEVYGISISKEKCEGFTLDDAARYVLSYRQGRSESWSDATSELEGVKRGFFEFNAFNRHSPMSMEMIGWNVRTNAQKILSQVKDQNGRSGIVLLFQHYLENRSLQDRRVITLSIGASAYKNETDQSVLKELKALFQEYGTHAEFFLVWQRNRMISDAAKGDWSEFESVIQQLQGEPGPFQQALCNDLIDGFDLVGSLHEDQDKQTQFRTSEEGPSPSEVQEIASRVRSQLDLLFGFMETSPHLQLKLHAWEKPSPLDALSHFEGEFYQVLKQSLNRRTELELRTVRIGHIGGIDSERDIPYFKKLSQRTRTRLIFEANVLSSMGNHRAELKDLVKTLNRLSAEGFVVVLGTDGAGILRESDAHFTAILKRLTHSGLSPFAFQRILQATERLSRRSQEFGLTLGTPSRHRNLHPPACSIQSLN